MDVDTFIKTFVKIEENIDGNAYGYCPFHIVSVLDDGEAEVIALMDVQSIKNCYDVFLSRLKNQKLQSIYMALDFPPTGDIKTDFIGVYTWRKNEKYTMMAIPYDKEIGFLYQRVTESETLTRISKEFLHYTVVNFKKFI